MTNLIVPVTPPLRDLHRAISCSRLFYGHDSVRFLPLLISDDALIPLGSSHSGIRPSQTSKARTGASDATVKRRTGKPCPRKPARVAYDHEALVEILESAPQRMECDRPHWVDLSNSTCILTLPVPDAQRHHLAGSPNILPRRPLRRVAPRAWRLAIRRFPATSSNPNATGSSSDAWTLGPRIPRHPPYTEGSVYIDPWNR